MATSREVGDTHSRPQLPARADSTLALPVRVVAAGALVGLDPGSGGARDGRNHV
jgi:hypothetical protein